MDKKAKVSGMYLLKLASHELFKNYAVLFVIFTFWIVVCATVYQFLKLFLSDKHSLTILSMIFTIPAGIIWFLPLVMLWDIIRFAGRNASEVITASELIICAFDYGIDCADETLIKNKSFYQLKSEFQNSEPFMLKRIKRNVHLAAFFGMCLIIYIHMP
ncbi:MAG: hypothetical protein Q7T50_05275 [Candidatus Magasanikbacteria bacterium]|nr:hypothetical protein [Candidatus Magasanikbacteria bacterium]